MGSDMSQIKILENPEQKSRTLEPHNCFACSPDNARGLRLEFQRSDDGAMVAEWIPEVDLEGYRGIVHGGVVSTVLDEAMAKVVADAGFGALTAELRVRFRQQVRSAVPSQVRGWIESRERRLIKTEASLTGQDGEELAHAWAMFLAVK